MKKRARAICGSLIVAATLAFSGVGAQAADYWQCAAFARVFSGIQIFGDAWTWWQKASGHYAKGFTPQTGAVLVFRPTGAMRLGHVAVVSQVLTDRVIQVTHANWSLINGTRGQIEQNVTVVDVSARGDWSEVKVWFDPRRDLGTTTYPTYGFIYNKTVGGAGLAAKSAGYSVAQTAMNQLASVVQSPSAGPVDALARAADSTDRIAALIASVTGGGSSKDGDDDNKR
jgi:surface antigen